MTPPWVLVPEALHDDAGALAGWVREAHSQALAAPRTRPVKKTPAGKAAARKAPARKPSTSPGGAPGRARATARKRQETG